MKASDWFAAATILVVASGSERSLRPRSDPARRIRAAGPVRRQTAFRTGKVRRQRRTCLTCHSRETGTISPADAQKRFAQKPHDPLFLHDGSDDGQGHGVTRMLADATCLVQIPLPPNVSLADEPNARTVVLRRGVPTTLNTPALDTVLMVDGRERDLKSQAADAIRDHDQPTRQPRPDELQKIADFEKTPGFFSSLPVLIYALGGPPPRLPNGRTESEKRGKRFFEDSPFAPGKKEGVCALCHGGPMLNTTNQFVPFQPPGSRFSNVAISEFNSAGNPVRDFVFRNPDGTTTIVREFRSRPCPDHRQSGTRTVRQLERIQDSIAVGHTAHGTLLPRQLLEDPGRRGGSLSTISQGRGAPCVSDGSGQGGYRGLHEAARLTPRQGGSDNEAHRRVRPRINSRFRSPECRCAECGGPPNVGVIRLALHN